MSAEGAKKIIAEVSGHDVDRLVRTASFTVEIEEVGVLRTICGKIAGIYQTLISPSVAIFTRN
jgi:hypothetical protein